MNETPYQEGLEIDLFRLAAVLIRKAWLLLLAAVLGAVITLTGTALLVTPQYTSSVMLYVNNAQAIEDLATSCSVLVKAREFLLDIITDTQVDRTHEELRNMITVTAVENTDFFQVTAASPDPFEAEILADAIGEHLPEQISGIMEGTSAKVVDEAILAAEPSLPNYRNNGILGFGIGFLLATAAVLIQAVLPEVPKRR